MVDSLTPLCHLSSLLISTPTVCLLQLPCCQKTGGGGVVCYVSILTFCWIPFIGYCRVGNSTGTHLTGLKLEQNSRNSLAVALALALASTLLFPERAGNPQKKPWVARFLARTTSAGCSGVAWQPNGDRFCLAASQPAESGNSCSYGCL